MKEEERRAGRGREGDRDPDCGRRYLYTLVQLEH